MYLNNILVFEKLKREYIFRVLHFATEKNIEECKEIVEYPEPFTTRLPYSINANSNSWMPILSDEETNSVISNCDPKRFELDRKIVIDHGKIIDCSIPSHMALFNIIKNNIAKNEHQVLNDLNYDNTPKFTYYLKRID